jgi:hypothetical protein
MTTPRRLSRGSHRLGIALAAIPLVAGLAFTAFLAHSLHGSDKKAEAARVERNAMVACARDALKDTTYQSRDLIDFQTLGCSKTSDRWTLGAIRMYVMQPAQNSSVFFMVGVGITLSLLTSLAVYCIVWAIGWVIGGFAAS